MTCVCVACKVLFWWDRYNTLGRHNNLPSIFLEWTRKLHFIMKSVVHKWVLYAHQSKHDFLFIYVGTKLRLVVESNTYCLSSAPTEPVTRTSRVLLCHIYCVCVLVNMVFSPLTSNIKLYQSNNKELMEWEVILYLDVKNIMIYDSWFAMLYTY